MPSTFMTRIFNKNSDRPGHTETCTCRAREWDFPYWNHHTYTHTHTHPGASMNTHFFLVRLGSARLFFSFSFFPNIIMYDYDHSTRYNCIRLPYAIVGFLILGEWMRMKMIVRWILGCNQLGMETGHKNETHHIADTETANATQIKKNCNKIMKETAKWKKK